MQHCLKYCDFIYFHWCQLSWIGRKSDVWIRCLDTSKWLLLLFMLFDCPLNFVDWVNQRNPWKLVFKEYKWIHSSSLVTIEVHDIFYWHFVDIFRYRKTARPPSPDSGLDSEKTTGNNISMYRLSYYCRCIHNLYLASDSSRVESYIFSF